MNNGRIKIICDLKPTGDIEKDKIIIPKIIGATMSLHEANAADIRRLFDYYYNKTDIRAKEKVQQPSINNKIGIAYPSIAVTTINGYCFSNSLTFSSRKLDNEEQMKAFCDTLDDDNYNDKLLKLAFITGVCGIGYKYIAPASAEDISRGLYYTTSTDIDPERTYCVYANTLEKEKTCAITYFDRKVYNETDYSVLRTERVYTVWTKWHQWEFVKSRNSWTNTRYTIGDVEYEAYPITFGRIPMIEYLRQQDRTGDFEIAMDLINAINALASSRVDDVQQSVDYVILLRDIDTESDGVLSRIKECLKEGILSFKSIQEAVVQPDIDVLNTKLNQQEVQTLQDFLCDKVEEVLNIPNREARGSGGDTGDAVERRNGFRSLENKASLVASSMLKGENDALDVILSICRNISECPFSDMLPKDVDIRDNRNKYENLTTATNAYSVLRAAGMNDTTAMQITRLVSDEITVAKQNKREAEGKAQADIDREIDRARKLQEISQQSDDSNTQNESNNDTNTDE